MSLSASDHTVKWTMQIFYFVFIFPLCFKVTIQPLESHSTDSLFVTRSLGGLALWYSLMGVTSQACSYFVSGLSI